MREPARDTCVSSGIRPGDQSRSRVRRPTDARDRPGGGVGVGGGLNGGSAGRPRSTGTVSNIEASTSGTFLSLEDHDEPFWFPSKYAAEGLAVGDEVTVQCAGPWSIGRGHYQPRAHCFLIRRGDETIYPPSWRDDR